MTRPRHQVSWEPNVPGDLRPVSIRFHETTIAELRRVAKKLGVGYQPLVRAIVSKWVAERTEAA